MAAVNFSSFGFLLLCIISKGGCQNADSNEYTCNDMGQDVYNILQSYIELLSGSGNLDPSEVQVFKGAAQQYIGIDIDSEESVTTFSCKLLGVTSLDELATLINLPPAILHQTYPMANSRIREIGGLKKFETMWQVYKRFLVAAHDAGYPRWPLKITPQETRAFISGMVDDFGNDFVQGITLADARSRDTVDIDRFVEAVTEATSVNEFVEISGWSHSTVYNLQWQLIYGLRYPVGTITELGDAVLRVMWMVDRHHLLDLQ